MEDELSYFEDEQLAPWLTSIQLAQYISAFEDLEMPDLPLLLALEEPEIDELCKQIGFSLGHKLKFKYRLRKLKDPSYGAAAKPINMKALPKRIGDKYILDETTMTYRLVKK